MNFSKESSEKIHELQVLEHHLQNFLAQKQNIQLELNEILNALEELKKSPEEVYKVLSGIMIKSDSAELTTELKEKKKLSELRISSIEKQEKLLEEKAQELKNQITKSMKGDSNKKH